MHTNNLSVTELERIQGIKRLNKKAAFWGITGADWDALKEVTEVHAKQQNADLFTVLNESINLVIRGYPIKKLIENYRSEINAFQENRQEPA